MGRELTRLGFFQSGFHAALIGELGPHDSAPTPVSVGPVTSDGEMEDFLDAYVEGWGIPDTMRDQFKANVRPWHNRPDWSLYVARVDEKPAATAILFTQAGVGYLADTATTPAFRRRGLHAALLDRRLRDATPRASISSVVERIFYRLATVIWSGQGCGFCFCEQYGRHWVDLPTVHAFAPGKHIGGSSYRRNVLECTASQ